MYVISFSLVGVVVNPPRIKPIHRLQSRILSKIPDTHDRIGLHILGQAQEFCQGGLSGGAGADAWKSNNRKTPLRNFGSSAAFLVCCD